MIPDAALSTTKTLCILEHLDQLSMRLKPLSNRTRIRLLAFLREPHYLEEVASYLKISHQAARRHVRQLVDGGLVDQSLRKGTSIIDYRVSIAGIVRLNEEMEVLCSLLHNDQAAVNGPRAGPPATSPCIITVRGHPMGHSPSLHQERPLAIGTDPGSAIRIEHDLRVEPRHAEIRWTDDVWSLRDLSTEHGTWHNWTRLPPGNDTILNHGDLINVGRSFLLFWNPSN